ncbi:MAG: glutamyl-tRNA synthetase [Candidatus Krumholzibacteriota bacterium]|nr:glutamyl-tRNA synthetase [Candidatus Krumholzibacteriota bacterium]
MAAEAVRVRFAPSPTGYLHVGGARTAIFNWLFARHHSGAFVLRIEDTDIERNRPEYEASLIADLRWLGLDWDEGPGTAGPLGPYRQSERADVYRSHADRLIEAGAAYPCFCSDEDLEAKRQANLARGGSPHYDGTCRRLEPEEVDAERKAGHPETVRFEVRPGAVRFHDLIRGDVEMATDMVGDFVLLRSNGNPTYNYAAAVDDSAMRITHVLRGEEHLPNTLRQILILESFGFPLPRFGHLPLILAEDRSKLSKRHGGSTVGELRENGYLPAAVLNYLVLLGWSHPEEKEILDAAELAGVFSLERVSKSAAVYDREKLRWMNGQYIRRTPVGTLFHTADGFFPESIRTGYGATARERILELLHEKIEVLSELREKSAPFEHDPEVAAEAAGSLEAPDALRVIDALAERIRDAQGELTAAGFKTMVEDVGKATGQKGKALYFPIRAALTGTVHGPDLAGIAEIKGRETTLRLLERARGMATAGGT